MAERRPTFYETGAGIDPRIRGSALRSSCYRTTLRWMVRGLYSHEIGIPWREDQPLSLVEVDPEDVIPTIEVFREANPTTTRKPQGNNVFWYLPAVIDEDLLDIAWLMVFFDKAAYAGFTGIPEDREGYVAPLSQRLRRTTRTWEKLRKIVDGGLVVVPPDDFFGFLDFNARNKGWSKN